MLQLQVKMVVGLHQVDRTHSRVGWVGLSKPKLRHMRMIKTELSTRNSLKLQHMTVTAHHQIQNFTSHSKVKKNICNIELSQDFHNINDCTSKSTSKFDPQEDVRTIVEGGARLPFCKSQDQNCTPKNRERQARSFAPCTTRKEGSGPATATTHPTPPTQHYA